MWCINCDRELSECTCPDLKERIAAISKSPHVRIDPEYKKRLDDQAERNTNEKAVTE